MMLTYRLTRSRYTSNSAPGNESDPIRSEQLRKTLNSLSPLSSTHLLYARDKLFFSKYRYLARRTRPAR